MMTTNALTPAVPPSTTLVAFSPSEVASAQVDLVAWGETKVAHEAAKLDELEAELTKARSNAWGWKSWQREAQKQAKIVVYYKKLLRAFKAGYLIIPDFPITTFAVRTEKTSPNEMGSSRRWDARTVQAQMLPIGDGRYVHPDPVVYHSERAGSKPGEMVNWYYAGQFNDAAYPSRLVKPEIVTETERAISLKVFDEVGLVGPVRKKSDPIIVGRILDPRGSRYLNPRKGVSFFVAWWLPLDSL